MCGDKVDSLARELACSGHLLLELLLLPLLFGKDALLDDLCKGHHANGSDGLAGVCAELDGSARVC